MSNYYENCVVCQEFKRVYGIKGFCKCACCNEKTRVFKPCGCGCGQISGDTFINGHNTRTLSGKEQQRRGNFNKETDWSFRKAKSRTYLKKLGNHIHVQVLQEKLGRKIKPGHVTHHVDGNHHNNSPENLVEVSRAEHMKIHIHNRRANGVK